MADATLHKTLRGHKEIVWSVAFSPDCKLLASASFDKTVRLWNISNGNSNAELKGHTSGVTSVAFSPNGKLIVAGSNDKTVRTWSFANQQQLKTLTGHSGTVYSVAWSPNGNLIASGSNDSTVVLWDVASASAKKTLKGHTREVLCVSFSQSSNKLVSGGYDKIAIIWDVNSGAALLKLAHCDYVQCVCFSRDDQVIITGCADNIVYMFNVNTGLEEKRFEGHTSSVYSIAISFDGSMLVSGSSDHSVRLWDVVSTKQLQKLDGHTNAVQSVAFSCDGKFIASGSYDHTVCLWSAPSLFKTPTSLLKAACFSGDIDDAKIQLDQGASINNTDGPTALYAASSNGNEQLIDLLIERGADINLRYSNGSTMLHMASCQGHVQVAHVLVKRGADLNLRDDSTLITTLKHIQTEGDSFTGQNTALHVASFNGQVEAVTYLLDCGLPIDDNGYRGSTALHLASSQGHKKVVELLITRGANVQARDAGQNSALYLAYLNNHVDVFEYLLDHGSLVNERGNDGSTMLHKATRQGQKQFVELLIQHDIDVNLRDDQKNTALRLAYANNHLDVFAYLLDHGAQVDERGDDGSTLLHLATRQGKKQVVELLIKYTANVNLYDADQNKALRLAYLSGQQEVFEYLLDHDSFIDEKGKDGSSLLHLATLEGDMRVVELLIKRGANINLRNADQNTALHLAYLTCHMLVFTFLLGHCSFIDETGQNGSTLLHLASLRGDTAVVELLIKRGANVNLCDADQNTALHLAYLNNHMNVFLYLLHHGSLVDAKGKDGSTILHWASRQGNQLIIELLIEHGADMNLRDQDQNTPFFVAFMNDHYEVAKYLLRCGALVNEKSADGQTMLHQAISSNNVALAQLLLQRGADINIRDSSNQSSLQLAMQPKSAEMKTVFTQATSLQNKNLKSIPPVVLDQVADFALHLNNNKIDPDVWDTLASSSSCTQFLVGLFLQSNPSLSTVSDSAANLEKLFYLSLAGCGLSAFSIRAVSLLPNLRSLDLSDNPLGDLPADFSRLKDLRILNVIKCNLSLVPAVVMQLLQLRDLDISNNPIHRIPVALASLMYLNRITLSGCPLTAIPSEFHDVPTPQLLQFLKDLGQESQPVYRSKLLLVGYGGVGKTTLLSALFPPSAILFKKSPSTIRNILGYPWEQRRCTIVGNKLVYERPSKIIGWEKADEIDLIGAMVEADETDQVSWFIQQKDQQRKYEFRCQNALEREEWVNACKFQAFNCATDGISMMYRNIAHAELQSALDQTPSSPPNPAPPNWQRINRVPKDQTLQLALCDFAGQHEYQDGHQLFLTSRSVYLVLWDVTPTKRPAELAKLRHWLVTLQLQLGSDQLRNNVLIYVIGTHADAPDVDLDQCGKQAIKVIEAVPLSVPYRSIAAIDVRNQQHVYSLKQQLLADLAVQAHLGEEVPTSYLDLEQQLRVAQDQYRLQSMRQQNNSSTTLLQRRDLASQLKLDVDLVTRGLSLLHLWGQIVYLGGLNARSKLVQVVVYLPEWLTVSVLGSLVRELRKQMVRVERASDEEYSVPVVKHSDLVRFSPVWMSMSSEQREQVMEMLYAFDLGFPESSDAMAMKSFEDRSSLFPQLLPLKPPRSFTWVRSNTSEIARIVELNGIPMGFHTVLLSRLRSYFGGIDSSFSWQSGFVFTQDQVCTLMTIHEDSSRLRFCVRNAQNVPKFFSDLIGVLNQLLSDRYKGLRIVNEFVECICKGCRRENQWQWNRSIADAVAQDASINALLKDTTARSELSAAILRIIQPEGPPFEFNLADIKNLAQTRAVSVLCKKFKTEVVLDELLSTAVSVEHNRYHVFISYRRDGGSELSLLIKRGLTDKGFRVFHDIDRDDGLSAGLFEQALVDNVLSSNCVVLLLTKGSLDRCLDNADPNNNDWVRREIATAIANKILIVPVVVSSFEWPSKERLPEDIRELGSHNAVDWSHHYASAAIDKIASFITSQPAF